MRVLSRTKVPEPAAPDASEPREASWRLPLRLARSTVYRRLPAAVRARLDAAILLQPADCPTLAEVFRKFELRQRYGISPAALRSYAVMIEQLVRPLMASHILAGVLGCLPRAYRQQLLAGGRVILLSKVLRALSAAADTSLSVAELARLASVLGAMAGRSTRPRTAISKKPARQIDDSVVPSASPEVNFERLAEAVRAVYGLDWPRQEPARNDASNPQDPVEGGASGG